MEIALRHRPILEGVAEDAPEIVHRRFVGVDGERFAVAQVAETTAVVEAHDVVGVSVGEEHRVDVADLLPQDLEPELGRRVDDEADGIGLHVDRGPGAVVFRIGEEGLRVVHADHRHALRCAAAEEKERERHVARSIGANGTAGNAAGEGGQQQMDKDHHRRVESRATETELEARRLPLNEPRRVSQRETGSIRVDLRCVFFRSSAVRLHLGRSPPKLRRRRCSPRSASRISPSSPI